MADEEQLKLDDEELISNSGLSETIDEVWSLFIFLLFEKNSGRDFLVRVIYNKEEIIFEMDKPVIGNSTKRN